MLLDDNRDHEGRLALGHLVGGSFCKARLLAAPHNDTIEDEDEVLS